MFRFNNSTNIRKQLVFITTVVALLVLELFWLHAVYRTEYKQFLIDIDNSLNAASQKEQTYRIPVNDIIHPGDVTIQSCGKEELRIIRQCPSPDTLLFNNLSGQSLETIIHKAFYELRKNITPLNIDCLADLFAGELQEKNILAAFSIDHFNTATGEVIETSASIRNPGKPAKYIFVIPISTTTSLRVSLQFTPVAVFKRMSGAIGISCGLVLIVLIGLFLIVSFSRRNETKIPEPNVPTANGPIYNIGRYRFDSEKNELGYSDQTIALNKKENAILRTLCEKNGNIAERNFLLTEYWGNTGLIYSRSLDTYIAKLRKYLKEDPSIQIITVKSQGYKLIY
ncbi:MAG: winged helix-turn-helix domain-containing protein [Dysgonamonadaceae bacterium]|nr:winged helix-turn-helix domain-containing protein [Dysgonamonadaceae bacterium]